VRRADDSKGIDGWISSSLHAASEQATSPFEIRAIYARWASSYDEEMLANNLQSYKSVTRMALELLAEGGSLEQDGPMRVLDAGCGTGLLGQHFCAELRAYAPGSLHVHVAGLDLSPEMLKVAGEKGCYAELREGNLNDMQPFAGQAFDLILSAGVFLAGHCGAEALGPMLSCLRAGGHAVFTVRSSLFQGKEERFLTAITGSGCELRSASVMPYYGEIEAHVLVVKKPPTLVE